MNIMKVSCQCLHIVIRSNDESFSSAFRSWILPINDRLKLNFDGFKVMSKCALG